MFRWPSGPRPPGKFGCSYSHPNIDLLESLDVWMVILWSLNSPQRVSYQEEVFKISDLLLTLPEGMDVSIYRLWNGVQWFSLILNEQMRVQRQFLMTLNQWFLWKRTIVQRLPSMSDKNVAVQMSMIFMDLFRCFTQKFIDFQWKTIRNVTNPLRICPWEPRALQSQFVEQINTKSIANPIQICPHEPRALQG